MPLKEIQYIKEKADILPLPTLPYDKSEISETIDILRELIQRLSLDNYVFEDKIVMVKRDWLTVRNITRAIYQKAEEPEILYTLGWIEPIAGLFYLQMNILKLFTFTFWGESNDECFFSHFSIAL